MGLFKIFFVGTLLVGQVGLSRSKGGGVFSFVDGGTPEHRFTDRCQSDKEVRNNFRDFRKKLKNAKPKDGFLGEHTDNSVGVPTTFYFYTNAVDCNKALAKAKAKLEAVPKADGAESKPVDKQDNK